MLSNNLIKHEPGGDAGSLSRWNQTWGKSRKSIGSIPAIPNSINSGKGYLRISYSNSQENLREGMTRILETLSKLE